MTTTLPAIQSIQVATVPLAAFLAREASILAAAGTSMPLAEINFLGATVLVGDGNVSGSPQCPSISTLQSTNALTHQVWSGKIVQSAAQNSSNPNQVDLLCVIPAVDANGNEIGPFWVTEFIVTDENGTPMIAGVTAAPKFTVANGAITDLSFIVSVAFAVGTVVLTAPSQPFMSSSQIQAALGSIVTGVAPITVTESANSAGWPDFAVAIAPTAFGMQSSLEFLFLTSTQLVTVPPWATRARVQGWAGGGVGGNSSGPNSAGSGGGPGQGFDIFVTGLTPGQQILCTIGIGATTAGSSGGDTTFGNFARASGGGPGSGGTNGIQTSSSGQPGHAGWIASGVAGILVTGIAGGYGYPISGGVTAGNGGPAWGCTATPVNASTGAAVNGNGAMFPGSGGNGGCNGGAGGPGAAGYEWIQWLP